MTDENTQSIRATCAATVSVGFVYVMALGLTGCNNQPVTENVKPDPVPVLTKTTLQTQATEYPSAAAPVKVKGLMETAGDLFSRAKSAKGPTAQGAKDWVQQKIGDAATASGDSAGDAIGWANDTFESLRNSGLTNAENTSQWLKQDWKNMQSWQYKTLSLNDAEGSADDQLNRLGAQGWECFHVDSRTFYFKKPADSYLRQLPLRDVMKLIPLLQQAK